MNKYIKPEITVTYFENTDKNMALVSANYAAANFKQNSDYNKIIF